MSPPPSPSAKVTRVSANAKQGEGSFVAIVTVELRADSKTYLAGAAKRIATMIRKQRLPLVARIVTEVPK